MTNKELLDEKIAASGLQPSFIIKTLGISVNSFYRKKNNQQPFKAAEVYVLCDILKISDDEEKTKIFYSECLQ